MTRGLNSSRSSCASTERPFAEFANPIFAAQKDGSINEGNQKGIATEVAMPFWHSQRESNPYLALRRGLFYPLNYRSKGLIRLYWRMFLLPLRRGLLYPFNYAGLLSFHMVEFSALIHFSTQKTKSQGFRKKTGCNS